MGNMSITLNNRSALHRARLEIKPHKTKVDVTHVRIKSKAETVGHTQTNPLWHQIATKVQAKLNVSVSDDPYEREADQVAERVMRMPEQQFVPRNCADCEEEEHKQLQRKPISDSITPILQTKGEGGATVSHALSNKISSTQGSGSNMDNGAQSFMNNRFGTDLSAVKIHTGDEAVQMNHELNAKAFTVGNDIYFNEGQYQPDSDSGKNLLAHELTHVVQQSGSPPLQSKSSANSSPTRQSAVSMLSRAKLHTDKDLFNKMQKFRSKNDQLTEAQQNKIFWAIKKATTSDEVAYKFFDYYSGYLGAGHQILLMTSAEEANAKKNDTLAETPSGGDTKLRSDVFTMPDETLGPLLLHEFAHTGHHTNWGGAYDFEEGQAYGIEYYYAERTGDTTRMAKIITIISAAAARWGATQGPAVQQNFKVTYALMLELGDLTKSGSSTLPPLLGKVGDDGRLMASEFVSDFSDLSKDLKLLWDYILKNLTSFKVPVI